MNNNLNRTKAASVNAVTMLITQLIGLFLKFGVQTALIHELAQDFVGLNGLFANIVSLLNFADLGIGTAITVALYKPIAENDIDKLRALIGLYKKAYAGIIVLITSLGLLTAPFIHLFIKNTNFSELEILWWFLLYLCSTVATYFSAHKRSFLMAAQRGYLNSLNDFLFKGAQQVLQIVILVLFHSYLWFLVVQAGMAVISNLQLSRMAGRRYPEVFEHQSHHLSLKIDHRTQTSIRKNVVGAISSKIGEIVVFGTDNILLSMFSGLVAVAKYSNYMLIVQGISSLFSQVLASLVGSIGNLHVTTAVSRQKVVLYRVIYLNALINLFVSVGLAFAFHSFINIWAGHNYLLSTTVTIGIVVNYSINQSRFGIQNFISGMGLYWSLRWKSVIEAIVNLVLSLTFVGAAHMGVLGVVAGTLGSNLMINLLWEPYIVFHDGFHESMGNYIVRYLIYEVPIIFVIIGLVMLAASFELGLVELIMSAIVVECAALFLFFALTFRTKEFNYFWRLVVGYLKK
ncbi:lipopolysaccharide biosynthesis protein [Levilactobacillus tujiorum]|uniref:Transporter n=1 Tax=Levilactobacillus tujiorum TaxID=2912243 RepID=A0ABX1L149_9LACO|nr:hypothetical protein [Levilactobacillus tujiorum]MCH5463843.1 hypothetical protein [Levilactobacillus tujiorum]NLR11050.1 hypothetical protein [Lactobacillus sp. HBUAS51387]NLR28752.1 hypothetical protein [Levilactobacillus tujiorum]